MKDLKKINYKLSLLSLVLIIFLYSQKIESLENRIIFKINDNAFTSFDLENRIKYLDFVGSNQNIDRNLIIKDFISANLFYEYYKNIKNKANFENKINEIFDEIYTTNKKNKKIYNYEINKNNILDNIKIDYIRKIVLENIFNTNINNLETSNDEIDLLYNIKIKYININNFEYNELKNNFPNLQSINYESILFYLNENNLDFFLKQKEVININKINKKIKENILNNNNFFIIDNKQTKSLIFIEKKFETFEGIIVNLYSVRSQVELENSFLKCENLVKITDKQNIIQKEYKLVELNENLKNNLMNINDYLQFFSDDQNIYIVLCNIKFDKEILKQINFNKMVNLNIGETENKFIKKYSEIYNLIIFDE